MTDQSAEYVRPSTDWQEVVIREADIDRELVKHAMTCDEKFCENFRKLLFYAQKERREGLANIGQRGMSGYCWSRHHGQCSGENCGCRCHVDMVDVAEAGRQWAGAPDGD